MRKFFIMSGLLLGLPLSGVMLAGYPAGRYLEFPPVTRFIGHAPFSWTAFAVFALLIGFSIAPFIIRGSRKRLNISRTETGPFPWWGWLSCAGLAAAWALAWTRVPLFIELQPYTFVPPWLCYIVIVNALTYARTGTCMLLHRTGYFLLLFPASAAFWWFFEYLNRFVQNWYYAGVRFGALKYFILASLSFSTVLPAVLGTRDLLLSFPGLVLRFNQWTALRPRRPRLLALAGLVISAAGLGLIGILPDYLFPLLWVSPLVIIVSLQALSGERHILHDIGTGNWSVFVASILSALVCGVFWEMWNYYSLARWIYSVPLVHRFAVFEMPLLGYAGYLPFGLECAVIGEIIGGMAGNKKI
ncbi:MAG TPA: hypothetical protein PK341_01415 [Spirochaetota bacterium]|nr:hypothetical protein [Spirochaetota bacterium]